MLSGGGTWTSGRRSSRSSSTSRARRSYPTWMSGSPGFRTFSSRARRHSGARSTASSKKVAGGDLRTVVPISESLTTYIYFNNFVKFHPLNSENKPAVFIHYLYMILFSVIYREMIRFVRRIRGKCWVTFLVFVFL